MNVKVSNYFFIMWQRKTFDCIIQINWLFRGKGIILSLYVLRKMIIKCKKMSFCSLKWRILLIYKEQNYKQFNGLITVKWCHCIAPFTICLKDLKDWRLIYFSGVSSTECHKKSIFYPLLTTVSAFPYLQSCKWFTIFETPCIIDLAEFRTGILLV